MIAFALVAIYMLFWWLTSNQGTQAIRNVVINKEFKNGSLTNFSEIKYTEVALVKEHVGSVYYCEVNAWCPFVLHVHIGWESGSLSGRGEEAVYAWIFGASFKLSTLNEWSQ